MEEGRHGDSLVLMRGCEDSGVATSGEMPSCGHVPEEEYYDQEDEGVRHQYRRHHHVRTVAGSAGTHGSTASGSTIKQHYYPEGGWGWVVVGCAVLVQLLSHGLHGAAGMWLQEILRKFGSPIVDTGYGRMNETNITSKVVNWCPVPTHPHWLMYPPVHPTVHYVLGTVLLAVGIAGVIGNGLALIVFTRFLSVYFSLEPAVSYSILHAECNFHMFQALPLYQERAEHYKMEAPSSSDTAHRYRDPDVSDFEFEDSDNEFPQNVALDGKDANSFWESSDEEL